MDNNSSTSQPSDYFSNKASGDPLFYSAIKLKGTEVPPLSSGSTVLQQLENLYEENRFLDTVLYGPDETLQFFQKHFSEIVDTNDIGNLNKEGFSSWLPGKNEISIEFDPDPGSANDKGKDVYIGGPAALFSAAIQSKDQKAATNVLYGHDGMRGLSNWKGSASYFHIRDAIPVYYWPDNSGIYTLYCTAKHLLQKKLMPQIYKKSFHEDPNFNKLRLNMVSLSKEPSLLPKVFIKNFLNTIKDVNLHLTQTFLIKPSKSTAYVSMEHASLTNDIVPKMNLNKQVLMKSSESAKALHLHFGEGAEIPNNVFRNLQLIAGDKVKYNKLTEIEMKDRGYDLQVVKQALEFPNDGYFAPYTDEVLGKTILENGGEINDNMRLKKILVKPIQGKDCRATKIIWEDVRNAREHVTPVNTLYLSLGPSVKKMNVVPPDYQILSHIKNIFNSKYTSSTLPQTSSYQPTFSSLINLVKNKFSGTNLLKKTMWASGLSSCMLVKVDKSKVGEADMVKFRDHIDAHNKHAVRLAEKEVIIDEKPYQMFVLQLTGGGHFPIKDVHPEAAINVLKANFIPLLNLHQDGIEFEIISARSCARGLSSQNVFRVKAPMSNVVMMYGIGGIGITTMAPNALLMKAVMKERENLSKGKITASEFNRRMSESDFSDIPHWPWKNPFTRNYAQFIDSCHDPREVARKLGIAGNAPSITNIRNLISMDKTIYKTPSLKLFSMLRDMLLKMPK